MGVKIIEEADIHLTQDEYHRYLDEYQKAFMFYAGTPPTFESYVRQRKSRVNSLGTLIPQE